MANGNQEREELHRAIWAIADELRGSVDGWDFKAYVLGIMFYRYISENNLQFKPYSEFSKKEIDERTALIAELSKLVWNEKKFL